MLYYKRKSVNDTLGGHGEKQPRSSLRQQSINFVERQCKTKNNFPVAGLTSNHEAKAVFNIKSHTDTITFHSSYCTVMICKADTVRLLLSS